MSLKRFVVALAATLVLCPVGAHGQETDLRVGLGPTTSDRIRDVIGVHGLVAGTLWLTPAFGLNADAFLSAHNRRGRGRTVVGASAGPVFRWPRDGVRPYLGFELGYTRTDRSSREPFSYDLGVGLSLGVEADFSGRGWFLEVAPRAFGNVFYTHASTATLVLFTLGLRH